MRRIGVLLVTSLAVSACGPAAQRWDDVEHYFKKSLETPLTAAERCEQRGGFSYDEQCYEPSHEAFGERDCRLRGGLYYQDECFFPERDRIVIDQAARPGRDPR